ncbi:MAG: histidine-type phosphatase [Bacteroidales bacterium]|nr:histidine-type phosphatase [Bacteroidales bacterium]
MKTIRLFLASALVLTTSALRAAAPTVTDYTFVQCEGSLTPYPSATRAEAVYPDSLTPVFVNHVGRHGARYPASSANNLTLKKALDRAAEAGTITPLGRKLAELNDRIIALSTDRWGALDSLGMAEQAGIATRMFYNYTEAFAKGTTVSAISSYSPRAMMSMFSFTHQLDRLNNQMTISTVTGSVNNRLMRPFDVDKDYLQFRADKVWKPAYDEYFDAACPTAAIRRVLGEKFPFADIHEERNLAITEYYVLAGLEAMSLPNTMSDYLSRQEANALWSCFNLRQYLQRTATTVSAVPADIAADLVLDIIQTTDDFVSGQNTTTTAVLRFGHAETLMPLLSLLRIPGCYYLTNYFDTVAQHWCDFDVVPMATNIQFVLFRAKASGRYYVEVRVNEHPVALRKGDDSTIYPWGELRRYLMNYVPLYAQ